jgi:hypothetical protein
MSKTWIVAAAACALTVFTTASFAQTAPAPTLQPDDTWTYRRTTETTQNNVWRQIHFEGSIVRNSGSTVLIRNREVDSPNPPREILINSDWSTFRSLAGKETVVHRPYAFPLTLGKTWDLEFTDDHPNNKNHKSETRKLKYRVVDWEDIEVPAGKFKALKIEADGVWTGEIAPKVVANVTTQAGEQGTTAAAQTTKVTAETVTGRLYQAYWYVPEVKREVKSVEENYDTSGVRSARFTNELESFKVGN